MGHVSSKRFNSLSIFAHETKQSNRMALELIVRNAGTGIALDVGFYDSFSHKIVNSYIGLYKNSEEATLANCERTLMIQQGYVKKRRLFFE